MNHFIKKLDIKSGWKIIASPLLLITLILGIPQIIIGYYEVDFTSVKYIPGFISWASLIIIPYIAFPNKPYLLFICGLLLFYGVSNLFYILTFKGTLSAQAFYAVFETNINEATEFGQSFLTLKTLFILAVYVSSMFLLLTRIKPFYINTPTRIFLIIFAMVLFLPYGAKVYSGKQPLFGPIGGFVEAYMEYRKEIVALKDENKTIEKKLHLLNISSLGLGKEQLYVIVIGESTNRNHMSIYGYKRDTTPILSAMQNELIIFTDVISSEVHTIPSIKSALTIHSGKYEGFSIIDLAKASGFQTFWISNQVPVGAWENTITMIAKRSNNTYFLNLTGSGKEALMFRRSYDEKVLEPLNQILNRNDKKQLIVIHLMGTHPTYKKRYPPTFNKFHDIPNPLPFLTSRKLKKLNEYDNAIFYNDYIVSNIIRKIKAYSGQKVVSAVLFFSDHGEEIYDFRDYNGRDSLQISRYQIEIPFIIWTSPAFKEHRTDDLKQLIRNRHQPFMLDELLPTLVSLLGIKGDFQDETKSLFSASFSPKKRIIYNKDYDELKKIY